MEHHDWEESLGYWQYMHGLCAICEEAANHPNHGASFTEDRVIGTRAQEGSR